MSGPTEPGAPPPEVPEEFAAAYRAAYEQALAAQTGPPPRREEPQPVEQPVEQPVVQPAVAAAADDTQDLPVRRGPLRIGTHRSAPPPVVYDDDEPPSVLERVTRAAWFVPLLLALLALLLIFGAYTVGRTFADRVAGDAAPGAEPTVVISEGGSGQEPAAPGAWTGKVTPVDGVTARTGCTSPAGVDASGAEVSYAAANLADGVTDTTWRCDGDAVGEKITLDLGEKVAIGEVGLIPGYAKTDEATKDDRYAENNRITRVRWTIGGRQVVQSMTPDPRNRSLRLVRVPRTDADRVELEILAVAKGTRNTTAISEVRVARAG